MSDTFFFLIKPNKKNLEISRFFVQIEKNFLFVLPSQCIKALPKVF
jgi:hypothetical protein